MPEHVQKEILKLNGMPENRIRKQNYYYKHFDFYKRKRYKKSSKILLSIPFNKEAISYKNANKASCTDLILNNNSRSFFNTETSFTGVSDCPNLVLSVFKQNSLKQNLKK